MISSLRGQVLAVRAEDAVIEVGGVGMLVNGTPALLSSLRQGQEGFAYTSLVVREDSLTLYGFASEDEKEVFEVLTSVSGIGPKIGMTVLTVLSPDELRGAIASADEATLTLVPGIGKKSAQRMILELKNKLGPARGELPQAVPTESSEVIDALVNLGWQEKEAAVALAEAEEAVPGGTVAQLLRASLQILGQRR